jgi:integrase/recombinase XerD
VSPLEQAVADYLSIRRAMGFKLERAERLLGQFVSHLVDHDTDVITTDLALAWSLSFFPCKPRMTDANYSTP